MAASRFPAPEQAEGMAMPLDHRLGLDQDQCLLPPGEQVREENPKKSVGVVESRFGCGAMKNGELMTQGQVLEHELRVRLTGGAEGAQQGQKQSEHGRIRMAVV